MKFIFAYELILKHKNVYDHFWNFQFNDKQIVQIFSIKYSQLFRDI